MVADSGSVGFQDLAMMHQARPLFTVTPIPRLSASRAGMPTANLSITEPMLVLLIGGTPTGSAQTVTVKQLVSGSIAQLHQRQLPGPVPVPPQTQLNGQSLELRQTP